jgi:chaperonin GroEL
VSAEYFGSARRAWADHQYFGVVAGKGDPHQLRQHILALRKAHKSADGQDAKERIQERIGKLMGGSATLWIGGVNQAVVDQRKALAQRTASALRGAVRDGVLPGGGSALLACQPALERQLEETSSDEERAAYRILHTALEEPLRTILHNAGYESAEHMFEIGSAPAGFGFDVFSGEVVDLYNAGIIDVATTLKTALRAAVTSAALALTIETIVHHKDPEVSLTPK